MKCVQIFLKGNIYQNDSGSVEVICTKTTCEASGEHFQGACIKGRYKGSFSKKWKCNCFIDKK